MSHAIMYKTEALSGVRLVCIASRGVRTYSISGTETQNTIKVLSPVINGDIIGLPITA